MPGAKFTIGRDANCDIAIADDSVSRIHAELTLIDGGKILLADRASSNGTCILQGGKPQRIEQAYVMSTDQVQFGSVVLKVSELVEVIQAKAAKTPGARLAAGPAGPAGKLVRCECGAVKTQGRPCGECGL